MKMKTREELATLGFSSEQITIYLNDCHSLNEKIKETNTIVQNNSQINQELEQARALIKKHEEEKMTAEQLLAKREQEIATKELEANKIYNRAKAKNILAGLELEESIFDTIVTGDEASTLVNANALLNIINNTKSNVEKKTREEISNLNVKPTASNVNIIDDGIMTKEKFDRMGYDEMCAYQLENPEEYEKFIQ